MNRAGTGRGRSGRRVHRILHRQYRALRHHGYSGPLTWIAKTVNVKKLPFHRRYSMPYPPSLALRIFPEFSRRDQL